eukprot:Ihof_evm2s472 gene=Ihof_evmTU2s472
MERETLSADGKLELILDDTWSQQSSSRWSNLCFGFNAWSAVFTSISIPWTEISRFPLFDPFLSSIFSANPSLDTVQFGEKDYDNWADYEEEDEADIEISEGWGTIARGIVSVRRFFTHTGSQLRSLAIYPSSLADIEEAHNDLNVSTGKALKRLIVHCADCIAIRGVSACTNLEELEIHGGHTYQVPIGPQLRRLDLRRLYPWDDDLQLAPFGNLSSCISLTHLTLHIDFEMDAWFIRELPLLEYLSLEAERLGSLELKHNQKLHTVVIQVDDLPPNALTGCGQIKSLLLSCINRPRYEHVIADCTGLVELALCGGVDESLIFIPNTLPHVHTVILSSWKNSTDTLPRVVNIPAPLPTGSNTEVTSCSRIMSLFLTSGLVKTFSEGCKLPSLYCLERCPNLKQVACTSDLIGTIDDQIDFTRVFNKLSRATATHMLSFAVKQMHHTPNTSDDLEVAMETASLEIVWDKHGRSNATDELRWVADYSEDRQFRLTDHFGVYSALMNTEWTNSIQKLDLSGNIPIDSGTLSRFKNLQEICLHDVAHLPELGLCKKLVSIKICNCKNIQSLGARPWAVTVNRIEIGDCQGLEDIAAISGCVNLDSFYLWCCEKARDLDPLRSCRKLTRLRLEGLDPSQPVVVTDLSFIDSLPLLKPKDFIVEGMTDIQTLEEKKRSTAGQKTVFPYQLVQPIN